MILITIFNNYPLQLSCEFKNSEMLALIPNEVVIMKIIVLLMTILCTGYSWVEEDFHQKGDTTSMLTEHTNPLPNC